MHELDLSANQARELTDRIKVGVEAVWELIKQAYTSRAWSVLGYSSWDDYCTREFGTSRIRLPREERQEVVASMREIGMSTRAIASATGNSRRTIQADIQQEAQTAPPESDPAPVTGTDGKVYPASQPPRQEPAPAPGFNPGDLDEINNTTEPPEPAKPRRKPITDEVWDAILGIKKALTKLTETASDDRFIKNKTQIAELASNDLGLIIESIAEYRDNLK